MLDQPGGTVRDGFDLVVGEQRRHGEGHRLGDARHPDEDLVVDRCTAELPDHRAELEIGREAQAVIDAPDVVLVVDEHVTALAVGVVRDHVEHGHVAQHGMQVGARLVDGEVVLLVVGGDEPLHAALAQRPVTDDGGRYQIEAHRMAQRVRRELTSVQTRLEVPQRPFTTERLVDALTGAFAVGDVHEERGVAAPGHAALDLDLAAREDLELLGPIDRR